VTFLPTTLLPTTLLPTTLLPTTLLPTTLLPTTLRVNPLVRLLVLAAVPVVRGLPARHHQ
jgi:hypothetical protein